MENINSTQNNIIINIFKKTVDKIKIKFLKMTLDSFFHAALRLMDENRLKFYKWNSFN